MHYYVAVITPVRCAAGGNEITIRLNQPSKLTNPQDATSTWPSDYQNCINILWNAVCIKLHSTHETACKRMYQKALFNKIINSYFVAMLTRELKKSLLSVQPCSKTK
jgi:hypothetical protein